MSYEISNCCLIPSRLVTSPTINVGLYSSLSAPFLAFSMATDEKSTPVVFIPCFTINFENRPSPQPSSKEVFGLLVLASSVSSFGMRISPQTQGANGELYTLLNCSLVDGAFELLSFTLLVFY